jgi:branched-chain amino acid transport system permease protein
VLAAIVLTIALELLREFQAYRMVVYALLLIALMLLRPQGIFGTRELWNLPLFKRLFGPRLSPAGPAGASPTEVRDDSTTSGGAA